MEWFYTLLLDHVRAVADHLERAANPLLTPHLPTAKWRCHGLRAALQSSACGGLPSPYDPLAGVRGLTVEPRELLSWVHTASGGPTSDLRESCTCLAQMLPAAEAWADGQAPASPDLIAGWREARDRLVKGVDVALGVELPKLLERLRGKPSGADRPGAVAQANSKGQPRVEPLTEKAAAVRDKVFISYSHDDKKWLERARDPNRSPKAQGPKEVVARSVSPETMQRFLKKFQKLEDERDHKKRGFMFESFLNGFFDAHGLAARGSLKLKGAQIDGSFEWENDIYKVEARWRKKQANAADLQVLRGKCETSTWTKGLLISTSGFSRIASETHRMSREVRVIAMSGKDLRLILEGKWTLPDALRAKRRHVADTGEAYLPLAKARRKRGDDRSR